VQSRRGRTDLEERVEHGYADSDGVKIHYASLGSGPLMVMIHGFPDYWYTWRAQMEALSEAYHCVAIDLRGYNLSDKPKGVDNYAMDLLVGDVAAVIRHLGRDKAILVGHDWGAAISWSFAMDRAEMLDRLIILNVPHPLGLLRELANNLLQQQSSQYAWDYQKEDAHLKITAADLVFWVRDPEVKKKYIGAFEQSDFEAMLNYYKRSFVKKGSAAVQAERDYPKVKAPVLIIYGLKDRYVLPAGLNNTWEWLEKGLTLVTVPEAGHFVQDDAADLVTRVIRQWLAQE
jgi:pimeloyl-ACP methyl ester carboxylesterase